MTQVGSMPKSWLFLILAGAVVVLAAPLAAALVEPTPEELEHNRRLLEKIRLDPDHYRRLRRDLQSF